MSKKKTEEKEWSQKRKVGQKAEVGQSILKWVNGKEVPHCPFCNENLTTSTILDVDLVQKKQNKKEKILRFERECRNCFNKAIVYREQILVWKTSNYLHVNEDEWEKIKEEKKVFKDE